MRNCCYLRQIKHLFIYILFTALKWHRTLEMSWTSAVLLENAIRMLYAYCLTTPFIMKGHSSSFNQHVTYDIESPSSNKWVVLIITLSHIYGYIKYINKKIDFEFLLAILLVSVYPKLKKVGFKNASLCVILALASRPLHMFWSNLHLMMYFESK